MAESAPKPDAATYNAIIGRATLRGIWMTESRFDMKPQALSMGDEMKHDIRSQSADAVVEAESGIVYGFIRFEASSRHKRQRLVNVSAQYFLSYHVDGGCEQDLANLFIERVGRLAAYPYFRALAASLASQAGVQLPPLPIMSFQPRSVEYARDGEPLSLGGPTS
jgi:hypothetical protein